MRAIIQRVSSASVSIDGHVKSEIGPGLLVLLGVTNDDTREDADWLCGKIVQMRIFNDDAGVMNRSLLETGGQLLVVSQFTLFASYKKGNRPSWFRAAGHDIATPLYEYCCKRFEQLTGKPVGTGEFGADMQVALVNDGPVTIAIDTKNRE